MTEAPRVTSISVSPETGRPALRCSDGAIAVRRIGGGPGRLRLALLAAEAVLLAGDAVRLEVEVGVGCTLELEDIAATVAYPGTAGASRWSASLRLAAGATLVWDAQPFILAAGADCERRMLVSLGPRARLCARETLVLGRSGERGGRLRSRTVVTDPGGELLVEELDVAGEAPRPAVLGDARVVDAALLAGVDAPAEPAGAGETLLRLEGGGALARWLGGRVHESPIARRWPSWCEAASRPGPSLPDPGPADRPSAGRRPADHRPADHRPADNREPLAERSLRCMSPTIS